MRIDLNPIFHSPHLARLLRTPGLEHVGPAQILRKHREFLHLLVAEHRDLTCFLHNHPLRCALVDGVDEFANSIGGHASPLLVSGVLDLNLGCVNGRCVSVMRDTKPVACGDQFLTRIVLQNLTRVNVFERTTA